MRNSPGSSENLANLLRQVVGLACHSPLSTGTDHPHLTGRAQRFHSVMRPRGGPLVKPDQRHQTLCLPAQRGQAAMGEPARPEGVQTIEDQRILGTTRQGDLCRKPRRAGIKPACPIAQHRAGTRQRDNVAAVGSMRLDSRANCKAREYSIGLRNARNLAQQPRQNYHPRRCANFLAKYLPIMVTFRPSNSARPMNCRHFVRPRNAHAPTASELSTAKPRDLLPNARASGTPQSDSKRHTPETQGAVVVGKSQVAAIQRGSAPKRAQDQVGRGQISDKRSYRTVVAQGTDATRPP